jgi:hypothetical protein
MTDFGFAIAVDPCIPKMESVSHLSPQVLGRASMPSLVHVEVNWVSVSFEYSATQPHVCILQL